MNIIFKRIPIPPTSNKLYASVNGRLIKSIAGRKYKSEFATFALRNWRIIDEAKALFLKTDTLQVDRYFVFHKDRIISKKGEYKKLDATNRIKVLDDCLSEILDIDDKQFIAGKIEKVVCKHIEDEQVIVVISKIKQKDLLDIRYDGELKN